MRTVTLAVLLLAIVLVLLAAPREAAAQAIRAATGGAVGIAGGAVITLSVVVARAHFQGEYLESADDLIHWQSAPMLITPAVGVMFGLAGREPLIASIKGSTSGMLLGTAIGAGIGWLVSGSPELPWAGGVIGAGAGMTIGGLYLGLRAISRQGDEGSGDEPPLYIGVRVPL
jgi:hypothetical protein